MSIYPRFSQNSNTFNSKDIVSYEEASSGQTVVKLDLSSFVQKTAPVFESELYLKPGIGINMAGEKQSTAFTDLQKTDVETSKSKLTSIEYSESKTIINDLLDLTNSILILLDGQINQSKISGLITRLAEIDANLESINSNDADIIALNTTTATHTSQLAANDVVNASQNLNIVNLQTDTENISIRVTDTETDVVTLNAKDVSHDASINSLVAITSTLTNDVTILNQFDVDISLNLNAYKTSNDANVLLINDELNVIDALNISQNTRLTNTETANASQNVRLDDIETVNTSQDLSLNLIESKNLSQDTLIADLETLTVSHNSNLSNLNAVQSANVSNISTLQNENTTQSSDIATLNTEMLTKHAIINNSNKLNTAYIGNGDVSNLKLSSLNDVRTDVSVQSQLNTINSSISGLDLLQDLDIVSIPLLQNNVAALVAKDVIIDSSINTLAVDIATNVSGIATNASAITTNSSAIASANTAINNNTNSVTTINSNLTALSNADVIHTTQITDLQAVDIVLQANIDLKQNIISLANKLSSTKIFDTVLNDSLDSILTTVDSNITILNSNKQNNITTLNKLNSSLLNRNDNLQYVDITSGLQAQLLTINNSISTLQTLQNGDTTSFATIQDNFDTLELSKLDKTVYDNTIAPEIVTLSNAISTLQALQDGDIVSFNSINNSLTNLTNTKHPLITTDSKLNSSLLNRDDSLQYVDVTSSIQTKLNSVDSSIATKQNIINVANKIEIANVDFGLLHPLSYVDIIMPLQSQLNSFDSSITTLTATDVAQTGVNTNLQNSINTNATDIVTLQGINATQATTNTTLQTNIDAIDLTGIATNATDIVTLQGINTTQATTNTTLQSNIDAIDLTGIVTNATDIVTLQGINTTQATTNATLQSNIDAIDLTGIATNATDIVTLQGINATQANTNTTLQSNIDAIDLTGIATNATDIVTLQGINTTQATTNATQATTNATQVTTNATLQTNIDAMSSKTESFTPITYDQINNEITHTYDKNNLFIDPLDDLNLITLNLTINPIENLKNYNQKVIINCLEFKSYVNTLMLNGVATEIKFREGDSNINLAPIAGFSSLIQSFQICQVDNIVYALSSIELFYNSVSNRIYDRTAGAIMTLIGDGVINYEINGAAYSELGATALDDIDGDLTSSITISQSVNTAVLGAYNVTYSVTDSHSNTTTLIRVINVIDTVNPVVVLVNSAEITLTDGAAYIEYGATASDNSLEVLTVSITGTVNSGLAGDYTVSYAATDSTGNTHTISRLIHVLLPTYTLQYSNPSVDIFNLIDSFNHFTNNTFTENIKTVGTGDTYLQGDYKYYCGSLRNNAASGHMKLLFSGDTWNHTSMVDNAAADFTSHEFGVISGMPTGTVYDTSSLNYQGITVNGTFLYFSQIDSGSSISYDGEYFEAIFPFYIDLSKMVIEHYNQSFAPSLAYLMGTTDGGVTYQLIDTYTSPSFLQEPTYSGLTKYNGFKYVLNKISSISRLAVKHWRMYGDIYTYE
jgi:hypothetical protein